MTATFADLGRILVIIPTYNEIENIESIVGRLRAAVPEAHVLIADDNSPDGTGAKADAMAAADEHVHVLHRRGKEGLAKAYLASFDWGRENGYTVLIEHDADGSHRPEDLPKLLTALRSADMVKGSRWMRGGKVVNYPKSREYLSRLGSVWIKLWLGLPVKDPTGGLNAFHDYVLRDIAPEVTATGYLFQVDLTYHALQRGYKVVEVPITFPQRVLGQSKMSGAIIVEALLQVARWGIRNRSAQLFRLAHGVAAKAARHDPEKCPEVRNREKAHD